MNERSANIWDELHDELDQRVFKGEAPRPLIVSFIKRKVYSCLRDGFIDDPEKYFNLYMTGSLTTFQYSDASDCDISLFPDYGKLMQVTGEDDAEEIRKMLILLVTTELDGTDLPGTPHPLQDFVQPVGATPESMFKAGLRSAWNFQTRNWVVPPERDRAHDPYTEFPELFQKAQDVGEKMTLLLDHREVEAARQLYKDIHKKRAEDPSDYSEGNLEYKWLLHKGLFDRLREEAGMHIAKTAESLLENPISYHYIPLTPEELNQGSVSKDLFRQQKDNFNKRAEKHRAAGRVSSTELAAIFNRYNGNCAYCGGSNANSFDHVIPLSRGGRGDIANLLPAHDQCNNDLGIWDENLESNQVPKIKNEWRLYPAMAAKEEPLEKMKVIYDFDNDSILLGDSIAKKKPGRDGIVIGEYDGKKVKLFDVAKQWVNANYFKKLWLNSFPSRPIEKIFFDKAEMPTRPSDQMTYTQKLPHLTSGSLGAARWLYNSNTDQLFTDNSDKLMHYQLLEKFGIGAELDKWYMGYWADENHMSGLPPDEPLRSYVRQKLNDELSAHHTSGDKYHDGSKWKHYLRNRGVIANFKIADGTILEGRVIDYSDNTLKVEIKGGDEREFNSDFLKQIEFKLLDKRTLSKKVDTEWTYPLKNGMPTGSTFGFIGGHLILGMTHHKGIIAALIDNGWTWDQLMNAEQCWGWFGAGNTSVNLTFVSDSGYQNEKAMKDCIAAFQKAYPDCSISFDAHSRGMEDEETYGTGLNHTKPEEGYGLTKDRFIFSELPDAPKLSPEQQVQAAFKNAVNKSEIYLASLPPKTSVKWEPEYWKGEHLPNQGCFGYVNGHLILGSGHHQLIMARLIDAGWTWEQLMEAEQAWGWYTLQPVSYGDFKDLRDDVKNSNYVSVRFTSDAGLQNDEAMQGALGAFSTLYHLPARADYGSGQIKDVKTKGTEYGSGLHGKQYADNYLNNPETYFNIGEKLLKNIPQPPDQDWDPDWEQKVNDIKNPEQPVKTVVEPKTQNPEPSIGGKWADYKVGDKVMIILDGKNKPATVSIISGGFIYVIDENGHQTHYAKPSSIEKIPEEFQLGDKVYYTPDLEDKSEPQVYEVSSVSPSQIHITWPTGSTFYNPITFSSLFTKVPDTYEGYKGIYKGPVNNLLHINDNEAIWHTPEGTPTSPSELGSDQIKWMIDNGTFTKKEDLDGIYQLPSGHAQLIWENGKGTWKYWDGHTVQTNVTADDLKAWINDKGINKISSLWKESYTPGGKTKGWGDIMEKAQYIRGNGGVKLQINDPQHVVGIVQSGTDPQNKGPYQTEIWKQSPKPGQDGNYDDSISMWDCSCSWDDYAWGRTRQWKKYEGRPCVHTLALYWESQANPPQGQSGTTPVMQPPTPTPGGGVTVNQGLIAPMGQPPMPNVPLTGEPGLPAPLAPMPAQQPAWSEVVQPGKEEGTITFPGTFSHWKEATNIEHVGDEFHAHDANDPEKPWLYIPEHETMYVGPQGCYHNSIVNHLLMNGLIPDQEDSAYWDYPHGYLNEGNHYYNTSGGGSPPYDALEQLGIHRKQSSVKTAIFQNGDIVRTWEVTQGFAQPAYGQPGYPVIIKKNQSGEVIWSDEKSTIAIFPLNTGPEEHHLVKVECPTDNLYIDNTNAQPFVKKH